MKYSREEVLQYVKEDDVKFIRLAFSDVFGVPKNVAILSEELQRAIDYGIAIDGSSIAGFDRSEKSDLLLFPHPETITELPWRPGTGKVVRMFCDVRTPEGEPFIHDTRQLLAQAIEKAHEAGVEFMFGTEMEFYLFKSDEQGAPTKIPYDNAGYMDIAPDDKGENVRREICLMLELMGIQPERSHHEMGPGQNEIDFRYADALTAADNAVTFQSVVKTIAATNGLVADFSPKPLPDEPGNGVHVNFSVRKAGASDAKDAEQMELTAKATAGILNRISDITLFLNPREDSYERLGGNRTPFYISWSKQNRSQLIRIPAAKDLFQRAELRSPDAHANPYLALALLIYAGLEGIDGSMQLPAEADMDMYQADPRELAKFQTLPQSLDAARAEAQASDFVAKYVPAGLLTCYCE